MRLVRATEQDNDRLLHYMAKQPVPGAVQMRVQRMFNFFNQYRLQSDDYSTYMILNDHDHIEAAASIVFRKLYLDGQLQTVGYATDLRVSPNRRAITSWTQHFLPILQSERKSRNCQYVFTAVARSQRQAYNAFIRPRSVHRPMPRYHLFRRFNLVTLHGLWPFHNQPLPGIKIRHATGADRDLIAEYLIRKNQSSPIRFFNEKAEFERSLNQWRDLAIEDFIIAFDHKGRMIGCVAPWSPQKIQRVSALSLSSTASNMQDMLRVLSWFGIAHPMAPVGQDMGVRHLTHLHADNPDIFYSLLHRAYELSSKNEFLVYPHFEDDLATLPPRSFISAEMNYGYYCILLPSDEIPDFLKPRSSTAAPMFEPAFL
jgi:hypothetical protein